MTSETEAKSKARSGGGGLQFFYRPGVLCVYAAIVFGLFFALSEHHPISYELPPPLKFTGSLAVNTKLQNAELLLKDQVVGPESIIVEGNVIYAAVEDGRIIKVVDGKIVKEVLVAKDKECQTPEGRFADQHKCGRPLGMRRLNKDTIVFVDAYLGVGTVNVEAAKVKFIVKGDALIEEKPLRFADDLDILDENTVILSDASTKYYHSLVPYDFVEQQPNGRVVQVNIKTGEAKVLLDNLVFPNGVQLFPDKQSVLISETWRYRAVRYYIAGPKKGQHEIFLNLPGAPDNIRLNSRGNFWIAIAFVRHPEKFNLWDFLAPYPILRKIYLQIIPETFLGQIHLASLHKYGLIIEVDQNGKILQSLHDPTGRVREVSQIEEDDKYLYVASYHMPFVAKVKK